MLIEDTCTRRKTDPWAEEMQFCLKKGKRIISCLRHMKASIIVTRHHSDQVIMQSPQGVEVKRNLQHLKPLEIPESDYSTGDNPDQLDQLSSPDHVAPNPQEPSETMESVPTTTQTPLWEG